VPAIEPSFSTHANPERTVLPLASPLVIFLAAGALIGAAHLLDPWAQVALADANLANRDLGRMLRVMGFYPLWALAGLALILTDRPARSAVAGPTPSQWARRGGALLLAPALGGAVAEIGKILFRRLRPGEIPGAYMFRSFSERPFYSGGLGLPSSHTLVAFAGAFMMARLFPRTAPIWILLAVGCGWTRVAAGAHYLSDVVVAAVLGYAVAFGVGRWLRIQPMPWAPGSSPSPASSSSSGSSPSAIH
jgi:membrane-associated phospholipid phosphatase